MRPFFNFFNYRLLVPHIVWFLHVLCYTVKSKNYTGTIEVCNSNGTKIVYEDGLIKRAINNGKGKYYHYDLNGKLRAITGEGITEFKANADGTKSVVKMMKEPVVEGKYTYDSTEKIISKDGKSVKEVIHGKSAAEHSSYKDGCGTEVFVEKTEHVTKDAKSGKIISTKVDERKYMKSSRAGDNDIVPYSGEPKFMNEGTKDAAQTAQ